MRPANTTGWIPGRATSDRTHAGEAGVAALLLAMGVIAFAVFGSRSGSTTAGAAAACVVFSLLFIPYPVLSVRRWVDTLGAWISAAPVRRAGALLALPLAIYVAYAGAAGTLQASYMLKYAFYAGVPFWLIATGLGRSRADPLERPARLAAALLVLWLPIDFGVLRDFRIPAGAAQTLDLTRLLALDVALLLFVVVAPVRDLGFTFRWTRGDVRSALIAVAGFAAAVAPLGLAVQFIRYGWLSFEPVDWGLRALNIYFFVAVPEEFLFRGLVQNLLEKRWPGAGGRAGAWVLASVIFGAAHLNNAPAPNVRYAVLATLAGLAYGWVWMRTRKVTASALTHGAVDWIWVLAFRA